MAEEPTRKLAVLLHADVVGSTALVQLNEALAHQRIQDTFRRFSESIATHGGIAHEIRGDALVAEFSRASDAVSASLAFQTANASHNETLVDEIRPVIRIGIAMGEVVVADNTVTGEGVVLAQRLEQLAPPGGVVVQGSVSETVPTRLPFEYESIGEKMLKGFDKPVRAFEARLELGAEVPQPDSTKSDSESNAVAERTRLEPPDKPSIAVLPFTNMSGDPEQEYFSDGITEDIITELSRFQSLLVIARNSTFAYKGKSVKVQEVGQDLGVQYIVEGSVRKAGDRVRVTVQLVEAESGSHIWAERYDRDLIDIFEIQDELSQAIVGTLPGRIESASVQRSKRNLPNDLGVYERVMHAKVLHHRGNPEDNLKARQLLNEAIEMDSEFASAYAWKACVVSQGVSRGYIEESEELWSEVLAWSRKGYSIDENDLECVRILCEWDIEFMQWDEAQLRHDKAFKLNPNDPRIVAQRGELLTWLGEAEQGVDWIEKAMRLDPYHADDWAHLLGRSLFGMNRYEDAIRALMRVPALKYSHHAYMAACYAHLAVDDRANIQTAKVLEKKADFRATDFLKTLSYRNQEDRFHLLDGLRKAGLPE